MRKVKLGTHPLSQARVMAHINSTHTTVLFLPELLPIVATKATSTFRGSASLASGKEDGRIYKQRN